MLAPVAPQTCRLELELGAVPMPARLGRALTAELCRRCGMTELIPTAELVVSELVTNAVEHAAAGGHDRDGRRITLTVSVTRRGVSIEVSDPDPHGPAVRVAEPWDEGGRGTFLVAAHSSSWGWRPRPGGKSVWAELALAS
jgi:anti-sigma regulatory factor (Ser/Thr protein kinase)